MDDEPRLVAEVERLYAESRYDERAMVDMGRSEGEAEGDNAKALVFGEISSPLGLFAALELGEEDVFVDLGSGRGQLCVAAALCSTPPLESIGVELLRARHDAGVAALARAPAPARARCRLLCEDASATDLSKASKVFLNNTAFPPALSVVFARALAAPRAPALSLLATAAKLPDAADAGLTLLRVTALPTTYCPNGAPLYVYSRGVAADGVGAIVDEKAQRMLAERQRAAAAAAVSGAGADEGGLERGLLRNAMLAVALTDAANGK
mmetsp:Transcript_14766/g.48403  ORF Transcript_14766/g.48403 Transcript_14766/m.48403 type:complete len:267 (-) Transcript_14766:210-1010(-)